MLRPGKPEFHKADWKLSVRLGADASVLVSGLVWLLL